MIGWCIILLVLGFFGIMQESGLIGNLGHDVGIFTWGLMLVVVGMLLRVRSKEESAEKERQRMRIAELERLLRDKEI